MARFNTKERVCIVKLYYKLLSASKCRKHFRSLFPEVKRPSKRSVLYLINKFETTGSVLNKRRNYRPKVLTEEKLDDKGTRLRISPRKSLKRLAQETEVSKETRKRATKFLKLRQYKTTVVHSLLKGCTYPEKRQEVKCEANVNETNSIQEMHEVYIPQTTVKIEKMEQEEEEQPQELEYSLNEDLFKLKEEYVEENVKEEPQSEDESNDYITALNAEEICVKKEEFEEDYDSEAGNKISL